MIPVTVHLSEAEYLAAVRMFRAATGIPREDPVKGADVVRFAVRIGIGPKAPLLGPGEK
jgi:hypothetical protein